MGKTIAAKLLQVVLFLGCAGVGMQGSNAWGQLPDGLTLPKELQGLVPKGDGSSDLQMRAEVRVTADGAHGLLSVTAKLGGGWHIYSLTQPAGGPMRTRIVLEPSQQYELAGEFTADKQPQTRRLDVFDVPVEEHGGEVTWSAPIRILAATAGVPLEVRGKVDGQICRDEFGCIPLSTRDTRFIARVAGTLDKLRPLMAAPVSDKRRTPPVHDGDSATLLAAATAVSPVPADTKFAAPGAQGHRAGNIHVTVVGHIEPATVAPGGQAELVITATPDNGWHVYAYAEKDPKAISKPTLIALAEPSDWRGGVATASDAPVVKQTGLPIEPEQRYHEHAVTWRVPITVPAKAPLGAVKIKGLLGYQTCSESRCDPPAGVYFAADLQVAATANAQSKASLSFAAAKYATVAKFVADGPVATAAAPVAGPPAGRTSAPIEFDLSRIQVEDTRDASTLYILVVAFIGGMLLNFMPCVLPVIGLKIMSFVQQAGEHRARVFTLNLWYSLGMLTIFWLLATLASAASLKLSDESLGWGEQFNYVGFTIPLLCVVFVMGLSFIGVWEIPIPGFVGSGTAGELAQKEGLAGAFFKGVLTTILATPCSGPGLATALTWSATKPPHLVYLVFTCMGLGMALPYLLIGAFPRLIRFIPRPGAWMDTFKQLMGFVLMGTVVYMFSLLDSKYMVPTLALVFALWASCWWIGRTPITASGSRKVAAWTLAVGFSVIVGWFGFAYEPNRAHDLPWEEFSLAKLDQHVKANRTVLVDFTARWCPTCKVLERTVLNTAPVRQVVDKNEVVTLVADWSDQDEDITDVLKALGSLQLPVIAIFPADDPYRPKKLTGGYTRNALLEKLKEAGPSSGPKLAADLH